jgi:hypothetical protein
MTICRYSLDATCHWVMSWQNTASQRFNEAQILNDIGLLVSEWCELNLPRKTVGGREIMVALDHDTTEYERRLVRRSDLRHALRRDAFPARSADEVIARPGSRRAGADVGKISAV